MQWLFKVYVYYFYHIQILELFVKYMQLQHLEQTMNML